MSEPLVQRALQAMPYRTSLLVVFFASLVVAACSGGVLAPAPAVWEGLGLADNLNRSQAYAAQAGGLLGLLACPGPGVAVDRLTPMLVAFVSALLAFASYFLLFWVSRAALFMEWPLLALCFVILGQSAMAMVLLAISVGSHNASSARRGFVCGAVFAAVGVGILAWMLLRFVVFGFAGGAQWYLLCMALAIPGFYFIGAFLLFQVEKPHEEIVVVQEERLPPLFAGVSDEDSGSDDYLTFHTDADVAPLSSSDASSPLEADRKPLSLAHTFFAVSLALIVAASVVWLPLQPRLRETYQIADDTSYLYPASLVVSALLSGFFSDFFGQRFQRPFWLLLAGICSCLAHVIMIFQSVDFWFAQQIVQGAAFGCVMTTGVAHLSLVFGVARVGVAVGLTGMLMALFYSILMVVSFAPCSGSSWCVFVSAAGFAIVGGILGGVSAILWMREERAKRRLAS